MTVSLKKDVAVRASSPARPGRRRGPSERGNALVVLITTLPLVVTAFGAGLDLTRNVWIRATLQNALDSATVAAAGVTRNSASGELMIDASRAPEVGRLFYALNRPGNVLCPPGGDPVANPHGEPQRVCWNEPLGPPIVAPDGKSVEYRVQEVSPNTGFLNLIGLPRQRYTLISTARIK